MARKSRRTKPDKAPDTPPVAKHPVLLDRISLAVHEVAHTEAGRYILDHVHVEQDGTAVATDGKLLLAVEPPDANPDELPVTLVPVDVPESGLNLPAKTCATVVKNLKRSSTFKPILDNAVVTRCDKQLVELSSTDLTHVKREGDVPSEGTFPPWRDMVNQPMPAEDAPVTQIGFSLEVLEKIVKTIKKMAVGDEHTGTIRFTFNIKTGYVLIDSSVAGRKIIGMTGRLTAEDHDLEDFNEWQNAILASDNDEEDSDEKDA